MQYKLTVDQHYSVRLLQEELDIAGMDAVVIGQGDKEFYVQGTNPGIDAIVQAHIIVSQAQHDADLKTLLDDQAINVALASDRDILKATVLALNDGSFVPGSNYSNATIKSIILAKL